MRGLGRKATGKMDELDGDGTDKALKAGENFRLLWHQWETTERFKQWRAVVRFLKRSLWLLCEELFKFAYRDRRSLKIQLHL